MIRQSATRNRTKGFKVKHGFQIALLLAVCIWLIYQASHSHAKRKVYGDKHVDVSSDGVEVGSILGRKENPGFKMESEVVGEGKVDGDDGNAKKDGGGGDDELDRREEEKAEEEARDKEHDDLKAKTLDEGQPNATDEEDHTQTEFNTRENVEKKEEEEEEEGGHDLDQDNLKEKSISHEEKIGKADQERQKEEHHSDEEEKLKEEDNREDQVKVEDGGLLSENGQHEEKIEQNDVKESIQDISLQSNETEGGDPGTGIHGFPDRNGIPIDGEGLENISYNVEENEFRKSSPDDADQEKDSEHHSIGENTAPEGKEIIHPSISNDTTDTAGLPTKNQTSGSEVFASQEGGLGAASAFDINRSDNAEGAEFDKIAEINANAEDGESSKVSEDQKEGHLEKLLLSQREAEALRD